MTKSKEFFCRWVREREKVYFHFKIFIVLDEVIIQLLFIVKTF